MFVYVFVCACVFSDVLPYRSIVYKVYNCMCVSSTGPLFTRFCGGTLCSTSIDIHTYCILCVCLFVFLCRTFLKMFTPMFLCVCVCVCVCLFCAELLYRYSHMSVCVCVFSAVPPYRYSHVCSCVFSLQYFFLDIHMYVPVCVCMFSAVLAYSFFSTYAPVCVCVCVLCSTSL